MLIVDSHAHIFEDFSGVINRCPIKSLKFGKVKIGNEIIDFLPPYFENSNSPVELLIACMDSCCIEKTILVQNIIYGYNNEYCIKAICNYPNRFKVIALIDLFGGKNSLINLKKYIERYGFSGVKIDVLNGLKQFDSKLNINCNIIKPIFTYCNEKNLKIMLHLSNKEDLKPLIKIIQKYRNIKFVICHLGSEATFNTNVPKNESLLELIDIIRENENVWVDLSSVHYYLKDDIYPFKRTCKIVEEVYLKIGPNKMMWGSDYPGTLNMATYSQLKNYLIEGCKRIDKNHLDMIMGGNAYKLFWNL